MEIGTTITRLKEHLQGEKQKGISEMYGVFRCETSTTSTGRRVKYSVGEDTKKDVE